jgi:hypothetical protein
MRAEDLALLTRWIELNRDVLVQYCVTGRDLSPRN